MSNFKALLAGYKAPKKPKTAPPPSPPPRETDDDRLRAMLLERGPEVMREVRREADEKARAAAADAAEDAEPSDARPSVMAVLFLLRGGLPFEEHWRLWVKAASKSGLEVLVFAHSHHPEQVTSEWLRQKLIGPRFNTTWGSLDLVKVPSLMKPGARNVRALLG